VQACPFGSPSTRLNLASEPLPNPGDLRRKLPRDLRVVGDVVASYFVAECATDDESEFVELTMSLRARFASDEETTSSSPAPAPGSGGIEECLCVQGRVRDHARALIVVTPGGFERMFEEGGIAAARCGGAT
jgi:hypothetical protein